ncbi:MAG TPA: peroxidase family protein [Pirellulales bacterium]|nr:peroxidase family protein [Pirellulales bacterium]
MMSVAPSSTATYQADNSSGTSDSIITVTGDTADEGTTVEVTIDDTLIGTIAIDGNGDGALTVPTSSLPTTVAAVSSIDVGSVSGTFADTMNAAAAGGSSSSAALTAPLTNASGTQGTLLPEPIDGVGNNIADPTWGAANTDFSRLAPATFADGISAPNGQTLPSARVISNLIANQDVDGEEQDENNARSMSDFVYAWGQFIDHDIDLTESGTVSMNIPVPAGDPTFDPTGQGDLSIAFDRSQIAPGTGTSTTDPAQFVNQDTSYIDGSTIYGSDAATAAALRTFSGGQLKTSAGDLLSYNTMGLDMADNTGVPEDTLFAAGDVRANENVELSNLTTLFVREHNYQATLLAKEHPTWTDQQLYEGARQIVIGEIQSITYNEWLPALMGNNALTPYMGYNPTVDASIDDEFSSAAFRLHTLLDDDVQFLNNNGSPDTSIEGGDLPLADDFFQPGIVAMPGEVAANLKYLASDNAQEVDEQTVDGLRNALFPDAPVLDGVEVGASDLIADDIQRGRDEGDPTYNEMRVAMGESPVTSFAQITSNVQLQNELQQIYGNVNNVELFVGLMGENHLPGSSLGQTEQAILATQFEALRDGDRYFYENADPASLVNQLNNTTLAQIIERNTNITNLQPNVFFFYNNIQGNVDTSITTIARNRLETSLLPVAGATVELLQAGSVVATTTTNAQGNYQFTETGAGQFTVKVIPPAHFLGSLSSTTKSVDITKGQQSGDPAIADFIFGLENNNGPGPGPGKGWPGPGGSGQSQRTGGGGLNFALPFTNRNG